MSPHALGWTLLVVSVVGFVIWTVVFICDEIANAPLIPDDWDQDR